MDGYRYCHCAVSRARCLHVCLFVLRAALSPEGMLSIPSAPGLGITWSKEGIAKHTGGLEISLQVLGTVSPPPLLRLQTRGDGIGGDRGGRSPAAGGAAGGGGGGGLNQARL